MSDIKVPAAISSKVLTVGNQYKNHRGGIGGVIENYTKFFEEFNFVPSYKPQKLKMLIVPYYAVSCLKIAWILLWNRQIKIVHIHGAARGSIFRKYGIYVLSKHIFRRKVIYHSHGSELQLFYEKSGSFVKGIMKRLFEGVDEIICLSRQWETFFTEHFKVKRIVVLENIVVKQNGLARVTKPQDAPVTLLFLGAIGNRKGIFDLLEVLAENKSELEGKIRLLIGGNGEVSRLEEYQKAHDLFSLVKFEGWVSGEKKKELLLESDVYILPSYNEGLPLSILEAMSFRLPVISTPIGGTPEVVKDGVNGFLVTPGNKEGLLKSIRWFINNKQSLELFGKQSAEIVVPYYAENVIPKLSGIYSDLLKN